MPSQVPGSTMSPMEKFDHAIKVRNRSLGPELGTKVSPYLDVEVTSDNQKFLNLSKDDLNMYNVLRQSTCRHGERRLVARRTLNALGQASGMCGLLNDESKLKQIKSGLEFAASFESMKHAEKTKKQKDAAAKRQKSEQAKAKRAERHALTQAKRKTDYNAALTKLELANDDKVCQQDVDRLTGVQLKVVSY